VKSPELFEQPGKRNLIVSLLLVAAALALYNPANSHPFANYDDDRYITDNPRVRAGLTGETVAWAFRSTEQANWHPLTWLSHALDCQLFHLNPAGHHFSSALLHAINAALLFLLLAALTGRWAPSLFVAALFAVHPINVESVAWIAERKNVLSTFFFLLALAAYGWYAVKPDAKRYLAVSALFAMALIAKPMVITFPFVLMLLDFWPLGRVAQLSASAALKTSRTSLSRLVLEKLPWFAMSAVSAIITIEAQQAGGAMRSELQFELGVRLANAIYAYAMYLWKMIWPARLAPLYPHPGNSLAMWRVAAAFAVLAIITALVIRFRAHAYLPVGWFWFLGTLVPVIGLIQVGDQAMADRYAYLPLIGIFVMISWGSVDIASGIRIPRAAVTVAAGGVLVALSFAMSRQLDLWANNVNLWAHTLAVTENNFIAEDNLGGALVLAGKTNEAYPHFAAAARINPRDPMSHSNMGAYLQEHGRYREAITQYESAIQLTSDQGLLAATYANLGSAYRELGETDKADESFDHALHLNATQFNAYLGRGILREREGQLDGAIADYTRSTEIQPTTEAYLRLGHALERAGRAAEARSAYELALRLDPDSAEAKQALGRP
jgi:Flp pilus assembly protein TadD